MADLCTYMGETPVSITLTAASVARGLRVTRNSSGLCAVQDATARGDYVTLRDGAASEVVIGVPSGTPAKVPALTTVAVNVGDLAYSATGGQFTNVSTSAVLMGRFTQATSGAGLAEVELFTVA